MPASQREGSLPLTQGSGMRDENPIVLIIDDDPEFRDSVARLLRTVGLQTREFSSVSDFLKVDPLDGPTCLLLDVRMPERSGLDLQRDLAAASRQIPIIFITAHADVPMTVQAMKGGAIEFLTKPFRDYDLIEAVQGGLARDRSRRERDKALATLRERFDSLSSREREVMLHVMAGRLNKQIGRAIPSKPQSRSPFRQRRRRRGVAHPLGGPEHHRAPSRFKLGPPVVRSRRYRLSPLFLPSVHSIPPSSRCR